LIHTKYLSLFSALIILLSSTSFSKENVYLYNYMDKAPFVVNENKSIGLNYDFVTFLNQHSIKYTYQLITIPKQRALAQLVTQGALLWVNPNWVDDLHQDKYWWIKNLITDRELYISNDPALIYHGPQTFTDKIYVGVRGYNYENLTTLTQQKKLTRVDVTKEELVPIMLYKNRADIGIIGAQTYFYFHKQHPDITKNLFILENYQLNFFRSILISKAKKAVKEDIESWFRSEQGQAQWLIIKKKWLHDKIMLIPNEN